MRWFRFYEGALDDPKVQTLAAADFKGWVNILCVASRNDGVIPEVPQLAFALRLEADACQTLVERLINAGLIDRKSGGPNGSHNAPHGWDKRQYKSDNSTSRVKRFRERSATVAETHPDTETETERSREKVGRETAPTGFAFVGKVVRLSVSDFKRWATAYDAVPDLMAELTKADDYYAENPPVDGKWFFPVSKWLDRAHQDALKAKVDPDERIYRGVH